MAPGHLLYHTRGEDVDGAGWDHLAIAEISSMTVHTTTLECLRYHELPPSLNFLKLIFANGAMVQFDCCRCIFAIIKRCGGFMRAIWPDNISLETLVSLWFNASLLLFWEMLAPWIRSEVKSSWPYPKPIQSTGQLTGRPFPLGRWTAVHRVCCECSSFQCELDAPSGAGCMGRISHDRSMGHTSDLWIFKNGIYWQMMQHCHILWLRLLKVLQISSDWFGTFQLH